MTSNDIEIVVDDPTAPSEDSPPVASQRGVDAATMLVLMGFAILMAYDNRRTGISWASDGPQPGYFPFYLSVILFLASAYGLVTSLLAKRAGDKAGVFVTRDQLRRVMMVFIPTVIFCAATQWLGLYVASFLLIVGFMIFVGKIAVWKSLLTGIIFSVVSFWVFEVKFDVIMPKGPLEALFGY
ncbi:MAG: tripartite tricarboxylate transporter TctB family protein [Xanthobacteraceae bacterium]|nr:tripartite tricarboxylate transporter TctB family protein [Xanthobacteraceae bacterium]